VKSLLRALLQRRNRLPLFARLERQGLSIVQAEAALGFDGLVRALRRCRDCAHDGERCPPGRPCPNDPLVTP
jgi:hypothetical protein